MKYYMAPMEGMTDYIFRNAYHRQFGDIDKYFTPFIATYESGKYKPRDLAGVLPENNQGIPLVPQILTNQASHFIRTASDLAKMGYEEVNLNLGCPSGTVTAKGKGSGFLANPDALHYFLEDIFSHTSVSISIKTRIGDRDREEFQALYKLYREYPLKELIVHPRLRTDFYKNKPDWESYEMAEQNSPFPVCYNGDLFTPEEIVEWKKHFQNTELVMLGRGIMINPLLVGEARGLLGENVETMELQIAKQATAKQAAAKQATAKQAAAKQKIRLLHDEIYEEYQKILSGDRNVLFRMKEIWAYLGNAFTNFEKYGKKIRKAERLSVYEEAVRSLFQNEEYKICRGWISK